MLFLTRIPMSRCYRKPRNVDLSQMLTSGMLSAGGRRSRLHLSGRCGPPYHPLRLMYMHAHVWACSTQRHCHCLCAIASSQIFNIRVVHQILLGECTKTRDLAINIYIHTKLHYAELLVAGEHTEDRTSDSTQSSMEVIVLVELVAVSDNWQHNFLNMVTL